MSTLLHNFCQDDKHIAKIVVSYFICDNTYISYDMSSSPTANQI